LPEIPDPPFIDLDSNCTGKNCPQPQDLCGDIDDDHNPLFASVFGLTAVCVDFDGDGFLNLPNCTSWRQPGKNQVCLTPTDAFPGAPSKCRCDAEFNVPIPVPPAKLSVVKTADPTSVNEPGGTVKFTVQITNDSIDPANGVTLDTLDDDVYGDLLDPTNPEVSNNTCLSLDTEVGPGETVMCIFNGGVAGNAGDSQTDIVVASGLDQRTPPNRVSGQDDATVGILDVDPDISVTKTADPTTLLEPGGSVTYTVVVANDSLASSDPVTIDTLTDERPSPGGSVFDLNGQGSCSVPQTIQPGGSYTCMFTDTVTGNAGDSLTDKVTASGTDDEGNPVSKSDSATVLVLNVPSMITLIKTANPTSVDEPGGDVTFTFTVDNDSSVDTVTIDSLTDTIYGDLNGRGDCSVPQTLQPNGQAGDSYTCSFTAFVPAQGDVTGEGNSSETNKATASGVDDDGEDVMAMDDATVNFNDVAPAASLTKAATMAVVAYDVTVTNDSAAEALTLDILTDDQFGDITQVQGDVQSTTCSVPQTLEPSGQSGDSYSCSFDAKVSTSPHVDTVTGTVSDDEGGQVTPSDSATVSFQ
jgi:uncharacterized repeat protein (TIGR01451 family)